MGHFLWIDQSLGGIIDAAPLKYYTVSLPCAFSRSLYCCYNLEQQEGGQKAVQVVIPAAKDPKQPLAQRGLIGGIEFICIKLDSFLFFTKNELGASK